MIQKDSNNNLSDVAVLDRRKVMQHYFPEFLANNKDFVIYINLLADKMGLVTDYIELFNRLTDIDRTPEKFLKDLSQLVGYNFIDEVDPKIQREIIQRIFNKYRARGTEQSIIDMAVHGDNEGYIGGDLYLPGYYKDEGTAVLVFPREHLFTWDKSRWSGTDVFPDSNYNQDGILEIRVTHISDKIKERIEKEVKPAGVKCLYRTLISFSNDVLKVNKDVNVFVDFREYFNIFVDAYRSRNNSKWSGADITTKSVHDMPKTFSNKFMWGSNSRVFTELYLFSKDNQMYGPLRKEILSNNQSTHINNLQHVPITGFYDKITGGKPTTTNPKGKYTVELSYKTQVMGVCSVKINDKEV